MSRITETRFGDRLITVEISSGGVYDIFVQAEGKEKVRVETVFTTQDPKMTIAAYAAVCKTLDLLHRVGDQRPQGGASE